MKVKTPSPMMRTVRFQLLLSCLLLIGIGLQAQVTDYYRYETVDVTAFRVRSSFTLPTPPPPPVQVAVSSQPSSLDRYFTQGNRLYIDADPRLQQMVQRHIDQNQRVTSLAGFRIQVYSGPNRDEAYRLKGALLDVPDYAGYLDYEEPNYRVRLGDFLSREDAEAALRKVRPMFPESFVISAEIKPPKPRSLDYPTNE